MLNILKRGKEHYGFISVKSEFESEGVRIDELYRYIDLARKADLKIAIKIGGCEAISDLLKCKQIGADYIIAPMIETPYALEKYIQAKNKVFNIDEQKFVDFLFNHETITTYKNLNDMLCLKDFEKEIDGLVFGRVDFGRSINIYRDDISNKTMEKHCIEVSNKCKTKGIDYVVGR